MNLHPENELAIADLRFLLPLKKGNQVLLNDSYPFLEMELQQIGVTVLHLDDLPQDANSDGAILPLIHQDRLDTTIKSLQHCLKDGSFVVWGIKNSDYWLTSIKPDRHPDILKLNIKQTSKFFLQFGFSTIKQFGNPHSIINPRYLVDLSTSLPTRHFIQNVQIPYTRKGALKQIISRYWIKVFPYVTLYPSIVLLMQINFPGSSISK